MTPTRVVQMLGAAASVVILALPTASLAAPPVPPLPSLDWRRVATRIDLKRLHDWREAFVKGLKAAKAAGYSNAITREGTLLDPDAGLDVLKLAAGRYRCRTIKLGSRDGTSPSYLSNPTYDCRITDQGELLGFAEIDGLQRPGGLLFRDDDHRRIFLGTMMLGDERRAIKYGRDDDRDLAGALERIGPARWRLVLPYPRFESLVDVIELVPSN